MIDRIWNIAAASHVIGSADGPTSIVVISRWENGLAIGLTVAAIVLLAAGAVIYFKKRR